jgi:hypothetical protein
MASPGTNNPFRDQVTPSQKEPTVHTEYLSPNNDDYDDPMRSASPFAPDTPRRGSRESSPAKSEYDTSIPSLDAPSKSAVRTFDVYNSRSHINLRIFDPTSNTCIYYVDHSAFTPKKPDMILFQGSDKQGCPIAGVARWKSMWGKTVDIGIGNPGLKLENAASIPWETMTAEKSVKINDHRFRVPNDPMGKTYMWRRTHHVGIEKENNSWSNSNYKLLDGETNEVLATFGCNTFKSWKKFGKFTFRQDLGEEWQLMALLTCLALIEKGRRRSRARRSNGGGGGGGGGG